MEKAKCTTQSSSSAISICSLEDPTNPFSTGSSQIHEAILEDHHHSGLMKKTDCNILDATESTIVLAHANAISLESLHPLVPTLLDGSDETYFLTQRSEDLDTLLQVSARASDGQDTSPNISKGEGKSDMLSDELGQTQDEVYYQIMKGANLHEGLVDTAAPFESVKVAASKFGGIADWKAQKSKTIEKRKHLQSELESIQEEIPKYKKQSEDAEAMKIEILTELDHIERLIEELKLSLEKAETQEAQARQDSELAELRAREIAQGISNSVSIAAKAQLDVAKERHENAVTELKAVKREVEAMQREYVSLVRESGEVMRKAEDSISTSKEIERNVEDLTLELITMKEMLDCAHSVHLEVEEHRIDAALSLQQDRMNWEKELMQANEELCMVNEQIQTTDDVKFKLDTTCALLSGLKAELASQADTKSDQGEDGIAAKRELEDLRANIKRSKYEISCLRMAASSLMYELDKEQKSLTAPLRCKEQVSTSVSVSPLGHSTTTSELDLRKAREEAEQTKAALRTVEARLNAVIQEIKASKASSEVVASIYVNSEGADSTAEITLRTEEYDKLCETARYAMDHANKRVIAAIEQIKAAKVSESKTSLALQEAIKELEGRRMTLKAAMDNAERTKEVKMKLEKELQMCRTEFEMQRKESIGGAAHGDDEQSNADSTIVEQKATQMPRTQTQSGTKHRKRSFLPRLLMFLARKKAQSLK